MSGAGRKKPDLVETGMKDKSTPLLGFRSKGRGGVNKI